jgi:putative acetyltransferase
LRTLRESIYEIASADYPVEVIEGWAPEVSEQNIKRVLDNPEDEIRVIAGLDGTVVGIGAIVVKDSQLRACYVLPYGLRKGVGTAIVLKLEEIARNHGVDHFELHATITAERFYQHLGYVSKSRITQTTSMGVEMDAVFMIKSLRTSTVSERGTHLPFLPEASDDGVYLTSIWTPWTRRRLIDDGDIARR